MVYKLIYATKNHLIDALQDYFVGGDWEGIEIVDHYPYKSRVFPAIILEASPVSVVRSGIKDLLKVDSENGKTFYGGRYTIEFTITIQSKSTAEKEKLADSIVLFCTYLGRDTLLANNIIPMLDSPRVTGESQEKEAGSIIYRVQISFVCQTEWLEEVSAQTLKSYGITMSVESAD